jgi:hypothetical protein
MTILWEEMVFLTKAEAASGVDDDTQERDAAIVITNNDTIIDLAAMVALSLSPPLSSVYVNVSVCATDGRTDRQTLGEEI